MTFGIEIVGALLALSTGSTLWAISASWSARRSQASHSPRPSTKTAQRVATGQETASHGPPSVLRSVSQMKAARRARVLRPEVIAYHVLDSIQFEDSHNYPILKDDLDDLIVSWCDDNDVERVPVNVVRNLIAQLPGVSRVRLRVKEDTPENRFVRACMERRGDVQERPTVFIVRTPQADVQDAPTEVRAQSSERPASAPDVRSVADQRPAKRPSGPVNRPSEGHEWLGEIAA